MPLSRLLYLMSAWRRAIAAGWARQRELRPSGEGVLPEMRRWGCLRGGYAGPQLAVQRGNPCVEEGFKILRLGSRF